MTTLGFMRPMDRISDSIEMAKKMGFEAMCAPSLEVLPGEDSAFENLEVSLTPGCIAVVSSVSAVDQLKRRYGDGFRDRFSGITVVAIGPLTAKKLKEVGIDSDLVPEDHSSEGVVSALSDRVKGSRIVLLRSDRGRAELPDGLVAAGADVVDIPVYRLKEYGLSNGLLHLVMMVKQEKLDAMAFTSPATAEMFLGRIERKFGKEDAVKHMSHVRIAAIGAPTKSKIEEMGYSVQIVPAESTFEGMLEAVKASFSE